MKSLEIKKLEDLRIAQIIDANLDRAREGLRVLEAVSYTHLRAHETR